jgi:hypothetical protein
VDRSPKDLGKHLIATALDNRAIESHSPDENTYGIVSNPASIA